MAEDKKHDSPCEYTKATRWILVTLIGIIVGYIMFSMADIKEIRSSYEQVSRKQSVMDETVQLRLKNIEEMLSEIKQEMKGKRQ